MSDTGFLYPFLEGEERDAARLLDALAESAAAKRVTSSALREDTLDRNEEELRTIAGEMVVRFSAGGRLFAFGNGGSATDADAAVQLFADPPSGVRLPAVSLLGDTAVLTALANDISFDVVFARQLAAFGRMEDVAMGFSTSGNSENVLAGFAAAKRVGMLTVGTAGYDGGRTAASSDVDHCVVVRSDSVHRIQEVQGAVVHRLWSYVQEGTEGRP